MMTAASTQTERQMTNSSFLTPAISISITGCFFYTFLLSSTHALVRIEKAKKRGSSLLTGHYNNTVQPYHLTTHCNINKGDIWENKVATKCWKFFLRQKKNHIKQTSLQSKFFLTFDFENRKMPFSFFFFNFGGTACTLDSFIRGITDGHYYLKGLLG